MKKECIILLDGKDKSIVFGRRLVYHLDEGVFGIKVRSIEGGKRSAYRDSLGCAKALFDSYSEAGTLIICRFKGHPVPSTLIADFIENLFKTNTPYSHLDGQVVGVPEFSIEGISREGVEKLLAQKNRYLPNGLMNGYVLEKAEPYWWTVEQVRYYLLDRFDDYYSKPRFVSIEVTPVCNLHCIKCHCQSPLRPDTTPYEGPTTMSFENWKFIIDKLSDDFPGISVSPTIRGEALVHPKIVDMVAYAVKKGHPVSFFTNANLLTTEVSRGLIDAGLMGLSVSLDSNDPDEYNRLQPGGDFNKVVKNIEVFLNLRKGKFPAIGMHFVESPDNIDTFENYRKRWSGKVDFVGRSVWLDFSRGHRPWKRYSKPGHRLPCAWLWLNMYIHANGNASLCGMDVREQWGLGNILEKNPSEIWMGKGYRHAREIQFNLKEAVKFCKGDLSWSGHLSYQKIEGNSSVTVGPMYICYAPLPSRAFIFGKKVEKFLRESSLVSASAREELANIYRRMVLR